MFVNLGKNQVDSFTIAIDFNDDMVNKLISREITNYTDVNCSFIGYYAFYSCSLLTSINFPNCISIDSYAFEYCPALTTVSFPNCTSIASYAFAYCSTLTTVSFPNCSYIGSYAFHSCSALTTANFSRCSYIGTYTFRSCFNLISFNLTGISSIPSLAGSTAFSSTPIGAYSTSAGQYGSIYVPASLYNSFLTATNWSYFSSRFVSV